MRSEFDNSYLKFALKLPFVRKCPLFQRTHFWACAPSHPLSWIQFGLFGWEPHWGRRPRFTPGLKPGVATRNTQFKHFLFLFLPCGNPMNPGPGPDWCNSCPDVNTTAEDNNSNTAVITVRGGIGFGLRLLILWREIFSLSSHDLRLMTQD